MAFSWLQLLLVGVGGGVGSIARYTLSFSVNQAVAGGHSPLGTAVVNITGCFAIGLLAGLTETRALLSPEMRLLVLTGLLGGFTTFSTFEYETFALLRDGQAMRALANVTGQFLIGLAAVALGYALAHLGARTA
mgnify:CR=1 FL=1